MTDQAMSAEVSAGFRAYTLVLQAAFDAYFRDSIIPRIVVIPGRRYMKVATDDGSQRSVYSFVDKTDGKIYVGPWNGPARAQMNRPRGSVLDGSWLEWHGPYGAGYVAEHADGRARRQFVPLSEDDYMVARDAIMSGNGTAAAELVAARIREGGRP